MSNSINFHWQGYNWYAYEHFKNDTNNCKDAYLGTNVIHTFDNTLVFPINYEVKSFDGDLLNTERKYKCAFIESSDIFSYGTYKFKTIIGNSPRTWPAIWLYGNECWPPEIDIVEAFPDKTGNIIKDGMVRYETNIHYDITNPIQFGAKGICSLLYKLTHRDNKPDTWELKWTPKYIKIYFNGVRIRKVTDKNVINFFNQHNQMRIVINNMLQEGFTHEDYEKQKNFELLSFSYKKL